MCRETWAGVTKVRFGSLATPFRKLCPLLSWNFGNDIEFVERDSAGWK